MPQGIKLCLPGKGSASLLGTQCWPGGNNNGITTAGSKQQRHNNSREETATAQQQQGGNSNGTAGTLTAAEIPTEK